MLNSSICLATYVVVEHPSFQDFSTKCWFLVLFLEHIFDDLRRLGVCLRSTHSTTFLYENDLLVSDTGN